MKKTLFSLAVLCFVATSLFAQKKIKDEAHVNYKITDVKSEDQMAAMMKGSTMDIYISKENSHSSMNIMSGMMKMDSYVLKGEENPVTLMQMMGNKIKVVADGKSEKTETKTNQPEFKANKKVTKEIAGYKCYEAKAEMKDGSTITLYITDKIEVNVSKEMNLFGVDFDAVDGFPLEVTFSSKDGGMTITAQKVESKVDKEIFKYNDEGFKEMTPEELQKMGIGGMGF